MNQRKEVLLSYDTFLDNRYAFLKSIISDWTWLFFMLLFALFVSFSILTTNKNKQQYTKYAQVTAENQLNFLSLVIKNTLKHYDYQSIDQFIQDFGRADKAISSIKLINNTKITLSSYQTSISLNKVIKLTKKIEMGDHNVLYITLQKNMTMPNKYRQMIIQYVVLSIFLLIGFIYVTCNKLKKFQFINALLNVNNKLQAEIFAREKIMLDNARLVEFPHYTPSPVLSVLLNGEIEYINPAAKEQLSLLGSHDFKDILPDTHQHVIAQLTGCIDTVSRLKRCENNKTFLWVYHKISSQDRIYIYAADISEIQRAKEIAEEASIMKSQLLANISHELRTPLNAVIGYSDLLQQENLSVENRFAIDAINISGNHLLSCIDDIIGITNVEANSAFLDAQLFSLDECVQTLCAKIQSKAEINSNKIIYERDEKTIELCTDMEKLSRILYHLLDNANKFTQNGTITIQVGRVTGQKDWCMINITDTGIGIEQHKLDLIFNSFTQIDASSTRTQGGLGLGLSLARLYAQFLGGRIEVSSVLGKSSTFTLCIPILSA